MKLKARQDFRTISIFELHLNIKIKNIMETKTSFCESISQALFNREYFVMLQMF